MKGTLEDNEAKEIQKPLYLSNYKRNTLLAAQVYTSNTKNNLLYLPHSALATKRKSCIKKEAITAREHERSNSIQKLVVPPDSIQVLKSIFEQEHKSRKSQCSKRSQISEKESKQESN